MLIQKSLIRYDDFVEGECTLNDAGMRAIPTDDFVEGECVLYGLNIIYQTLTNNEHNSTKCRCCISKR